MRALILGGGISGLTAAKTLQALGCDYLLLEQCPTLGGLTRTVEVGDFLFDYTGHFLHLCRYKSPGDIPYADLNDDEWQQVDRRSCCYVAGEIIPAPIQYNLGRLPAETLRECVKSYQDRPALVSSEHVTFRDYIVSGFGKYLADLFLIPQNEKTMAIGLDQLSIAAVKRFFPPPVDALVRAGIEGTSPASAGYNSRFWYPKSGGIGRLVEGLANGLKSVRTNHQVVEINLHERMVTTTDRQDFRFDFLFSSMPLPSLCRATKEPDLVDAADGLSHSSTISFNIGLQGSLPAELADVHWVYIPDRSIPFYRVGVYSNISKGACTPGHNALYAEVGIPGDVVPPDIVKQLQPCVIASLEKLGWIASRAVTCIVIHVIRHAYVHHTAYRERSIGEIFSRLNQFGVYPIGRYGLWDYTSMEDSIDSASSTVHEVLA